jgi:hypothetical protein
VNTADISPKGINMLVDPVDCQALIPKSIVACRFPIGFFEESMTSQEAKNVESVPHRNKNSLKLASGYELCRIHADLLARISNLEPPTVEPDHDGPFFVWIGGIGNRSPNIEPKAVLVINMLWDMFTDHFRVIWLRAHRAKHCGVVRTDPIG